MDDSAKPTSVPAAELTRNFGLWQDRTAQGPVLVTHHGRPRVVLMSVQDYAGIVGNLPEASNPGGDEIAGLLLDRLDDGFVAFDQLEIVRRVNTAAALHFRRSPEEIVGRPLDRIDDMPGNPVVIGYARRALLGGEVAAIDAPSARYPGEIMRVQIFPFPGGGACLFRNVTPQRRAAEIAAGQAALSDALDCHGGVIHARLTTDGHFAEVGESHARRLGFAAGGLDQICLFDLLGVACRARARAAFDAVVRQRQARAFDGQLLVEGGAERTVRIALAPIREDFAIDGVMLVITQ